MGNYYCIDVYIYDHQAHRHGLFMVSMQQALINNIKELSMNSFSEFCLM